MSNTLTIQVADGQFNCYVARPANASNAPVIVVLQEIFGVNATIRAIADDYAARGYIAVAPDLFWRSEAGISLSEQDAGDWARGFALYSGYDVDAGVADIAAVIAAARTLPGASGKVGVTGYNLGGLMTYLSATRAEADAFVAYYGGGTEKYIGEVLNVDKPLLYHLAEEDEYINRAAQTAILDAFKSNPHIELHNYPASNHAFARPGGNFYNDAVATLAKSRTDAFFRQNLV